MERIGGDSSGVTVESVNALVQIYASGLELESIDINASSSIDTICKFNFKNGSTYEASGFSIGYGGEGPRGLIKVIDLYSPNNDSSKQVPSLHYGNWKWTPKGFQKA